MSRTIRTPKIYRSRREFIKALVEHKRTLDFSYPEGSIQADNANPYKAYITVLDRHAGRTA